MNFQEFKDSYQKVPVEEYPNNVPANPLVSVCVQTYQHAPYIRDCLDGILMQETDFDYEILLGEDQSTDGTREICIEYAEKYPDKIRLFLHHRENNISILRRPSGRFNILYNIYSSKGSYIAICEGDDYWTDENKLQHQFDAMTLNPQFSICSHNYIEVHEHKNIPSRTSFDRFEYLTKRPYKSSFYTIDYNDYCRNLSGMHTATLFFRFSDFEWPEWGNKILSGDYAFKLILLHKGPAIIIRDTMSVLRKNLGGITQQQNSPLNKFKIHKHQFLLLMNKVSKNQKKYFAHRLWKSYINYIVGRGDYKHSKFISRLYYIPGLFHSTWLNIWHRL